MTTLHRKWSPKVALARTKVDDGGVAACLNWSYGTRSKKVNSKQPEEQEQPEQPEQREQPEHEELNYVLPFQDAVDRVFLDIRLNKENDLTKPESPSHSLVIDPDERPVNSPKGNISRLEGRPGTRMQMRPSTAPQQRVRPQTGSKCQHIAPIDRVSVKAVQVGIESRMTDVATNTGKQQPLNSTKKFLRKYFNKPLSDEELRYILKETHKRISDDLVEATLQDRSKPRPPPKTRSLGGQPTSQVMKIPRQQYQLELTNNDTKLLPRPASAQGVPRDNVLAASRMARPMSAASMTQRTPEVTAHNKHFSAWRPNGVAPRNGWTQSCNNYDDLWRLAAKYRTKRQTTPKVLGACQYNNKHVDIESQYLRHRPSSANGNLSLQLNCCQNADMTINIRLQKSHVGSAY